MYLNVAINSINWQGRKSKKSKKFTLKEFLTIVGSVDSAVLGYN